MLENIESVFRSFDESIRASTDEKERLVQLRNRAVDVLATEPRVLRVVDAGSYRHGTEVGQHSWFDVLVVLSGKPTSAAKASELVAAAVAPLGDPETGGIGPGATGLGYAGLGDAGLDEIALGGAGRWAVGAAPDDGPPGLRLIPAFEAPSSISAAGGDVVVLADPAKRWVATRIGARETLLSRIDDDGLRPLIRLVLAWKHRVRASMSSYYLETAVIRQALQQPSFSVLWDLCWTFEQLAADDLMTLTDISSPVPRQGVRAAASLARRIEGGYLVEPAAALLRSAVNASIDGDNTIVGDRLRALFGPQFPAL
ncbi:hypothetical protein [Subtercola endophyticus]|uniref:hypothetical protein n=1 Tax=Subtercola endophyticus TaxID=2895559 RepID=UPI001E593286|nr:hypothetical protein [Subtercola endophyticus]UFS57463.1 hypothetical protein LQ955_10350 [Subtercola endophyticus]